MIDRTQFRFFHPLRVRWNECDAQGIVFNVNYFLYYDIGMFEWQRALGYSRDEAPELLTVRAEADYKASAVFDDELEIAMRCGRLGNKSMAMACGIFRGDELLNAGSLTYVYVTKGTIETAPLDPEFVERIKEFEATPPETP